MICCVFVCLFVFVRHGHFFACQEQEPPKKKSRLSAARRVDESLERSIMRKFNHLPIEVIQTVKVRNMTIRQHVENEKARLDDKGRIGSLFWTKLVNEVTMMVGALVHVKPTVKALQHDQQRQFDAHINCLSTPVFGDLFGVRVGRGHVSFEFCWRAVLPSNQCL